MKVHLDEQGPGDRSSLHKSEFLFLHSSCVLISASPELGAVNFLFPEVSILLSEMEAGLKPWKCHEHQGTNRVSSVTHSKLVFGTLMDAPVLPSPRLHYSFHHLSLETIRT